MTSTNRAGQQHPTRDLDLAFIQLNLKDKARLMKLSLLCKRKGILLFTATFVCNVTLSVAISIVVTELNINRIRRRCYTETLISPQSESISSIFATVKWESPPLAWSESAFFEERSSGADDSRFFKTACKFWAFIVSIDVFWLMAEMWPRFVKAAIRFKLGTIGDCWLNAKC